MGLLRWVTSTLRTVQREAQWREWQAARTEATARGELVASKAERRVADTLAKLGIPYHYEARVAGFCPDFFVPDWNLIIEYWGVDPPGSPRRRRNVAAYLRGGFNLVNLENDDWHDLEGVLLRKLCRWDRGVYYRYERARG